MKILITGGTGFLGGIISNFLSHNNNIHTLSRSNATYNVSLSNDTPFFKNSFDLVIHAAGKAHSLYRSELEKEVFSGVNVTGTHNLLRGLFNSGIPKMFVYISSVSVYGLTNGVCINETSPLIAEDPYGRSKIEAEEIVKKWCYKHNVICTILRLPLVVGQNPPGNLGAMIRGIKKRYYFNIAGGKAKKSMVLALDVAKFILKAAVVGGTYNLTDGIHPTFKQLSKSISTKLNIKFVPNLSLFSAYVLAKIGDIIGDPFPINSNKLLKITSDLTFDDSKARLAFGWEPTPVLFGIKL